jgi:hypothetical protein
MQHDLENILPTMVPPGDDDEGPHETTGRGKYLRKRGGGKDWEADDAEEDGEAEGTGAGTGFMGYSRKSAHPPTADANYAPRDRDARVRYASFLYIAPQHSNSMQHRTC